MQSAAIATAVKGNSSTCYFRASTNYSSASQVMPAKPVASAAECCEWCSSSTKCSVAVYAGGLCRAMGPNGIPIDASGFTTVFKDDCQSYDNSNMLVCSMVPQCAPCQTSPFQCINDTTNACCGYPGTGCGVKVCKVGQECCLPAGGYCEGSSTQCCPQGKCCSGYSASNCVGDGQQCCFGGQVCAVTATCCPNVDPSSPFSICCPEGTSCCSNPGQSPMCCTKDQVCNMEQGCIAK